MSKPVRCARCAQFPDDHPVKAVRKELNADGTELGQWLRVICADPVPRPPRLVRWANAVLDRLEDRKRRRWAS
jgi:hypothetical protein